MVQWALAVDVSDGAATSGHRSAKKASTFNHRREKAASGHYRLVAVLAGVAVGAEGKVAARDLADGAVCTLSLPNLTGRANREDEKRQLRSGARERKHMT